jgi:DNA helicase-2/ATP-dependent DNA helicase PcrA
VDEYQDTNPIQARLTHLLGKDHLNVTAVGDEAQSIYAFRGASFRNIMDFPNIFPGTKVLKLEDNYRSVKPVLVMANSILSKAKEKYDKKLQSVRGDGPKPQLVAVSDLSAEASFVYEQIQEALKKGVPLEEMAVLFRSASHSFELEVLLARKKVPFTKYGGRKFLETAHIKDFLSFLRLCSNASDSQSLMRVVGMLPGFGPKGSQDLANWVGGKWENLVNLKDAPVSAKSKEKLAPLSSLMSVIAQPGDDLKERVKLVSGYYGEMLSELYPDDYPQRESDLLELKRMAEEGVNLTSFLADLTLDPPNSSRSKQAFDQKKVDLTLSTIHSAKGMEWSQVFILSVLEGRFPSSYRVKTEDEVEEERRLMYVAVTRAKDRLFIMIPMVEPSYGYDNNYDIEPSRFLGGLPNGAAEVYKNGKSVKYKALWNDYDFEEYEEEKEDEVKKAKETKILLEDKKPIKKAVTNCQDNLKILVSRKVENEVIFIPEVGQRVIHPAFGSGQVVKMSEKKATIDFDRFGPKNVVIAFAHLVPEVKPSR